MAALISSKMMRRMLSEWLYRLDPRVVVVAAAATVVVIDVGRSISR